MLTWSEYGKTLDILNAHAGVVASDFKVPSKKFSSQFTKLVKALEKADFVGDYLDKGDCEVAGAYWEFRHCLKSEVKTKKKSVKAPKHAKAPKHVKTSKHVKPSKPVHKK